MGWIVAHSSKKFCKNFVSKGVLVKLIIFLFCFYHFEPFKHRILRLYTFKKTKFIICWIVDEIGEKEKLQLFTFFWDILHLISTPDWCISRQIQVKSYLKTLLSALKSCDKVAVTASF